MWFILWNNGYVHRIEQGIPKNCWGKVRFPRCQDVIESLLMYWVGNEIELGLGKW